MSSVSVSFLSIFIRLTATDWLTVWLSVWQSTSLSVYFGKLVLTENRVYVIIKSVSHKRSSAIDDIKNATRFADLKLTVSCKKSKIINFKHLMLNVIGFVTWTSNGRRVKHKTILLLWVNSACAYRFCFVLFADEVDTLMQITRSRRCPSVEAGNQKKRKRNTDVTLML